MSATTVNAFPPLHAFNSSRSWFIVLIVLVHLGFFWALTQGRPIIVENVRPVIVDFLPAPAKPQPRPHEIEPVDPKPHQIDVPVPLPPEFEYREQRVDTAPQTGPRADTPPTTATEGSGSGPLIVEPKSDPRYPFTEPEYPVSEIRLQHQGTVLLKVQVLPSGRVGEVRIEQSSGFAKLDESAVREARSYRMKPGTQDGVATAMWVRVPIKFQLKN